MFGYNAEWWVEAIAFLQQPTHMGYVELLRELVEDRRVARLVLLDDGGDERDELVPELQVVLPRTRVLRMVRRGTALLLRGLAASVLYNSGLGQILLNASKIRYRN